MTTTSFDDFSSEEWGPRSRKSRRGLSRAGVIGLGLALVLSATFLAGGHYSVPFVQFIGNYPEEAAAPATSANVAAPESVDKAAREGTPQFTDGRGDRIFSGSAEAVHASSQTAKGDRIARDNAAIDRHRLAYALDTEPTVRQPSQERFLAPARTAESAKLSKILMASRSQKFARMEMPDAGTSDGAAIRSLASAIRADIDSDMPHPTMRPEVQLASLTAPEEESQPLAQRFADSVPVPTARPEAPQRAVRELASIASEAEGEAPLAPALNPERSSAGLPDEAPLPKTRPARRAAAPAAATGQRASTALAYAPSSGATDDGGGGGLLGGLGKLFSGGGGHSQLPGPGSGVAVYDISAATVYLPNGAKLEAHSGLGHMQDDPRYVDKKNKGPTPPNVYNLVMRESLFHGVQAIRLLPANGKKKFNRDGLLAHTYMYRYGDSSQSNGCVVFKDYKRFLHAFKQGQIRHMVVVPNMSKLPTYMAAL